MRPSPLPSIALSTIAVAVATLLAGCGGGGNSDSAPPPTRLSGVAATGAALAGATVTVIDSDAATTDPAAVTAGADGSYSVDVTGLKAPFIVKVVGQIEGLSTTIVALVPSVAANADNTANVTPLTHAVAALVAPGGDPLALLSPAALTSSVTLQKVSDASTLLVNTLKSDPQFAAALGSGFDPLTTRFSANGSGIDAVLDKLAVEVGASGVAITNLAAPVAGSGAPAPVVLAAGQTVAAALPLSAAAGELPSADALAALAAKLQACLALPLAQRVTLDDSGNVTALSPTCDYAPAGWMSQGRSWLQQVGQYTFAKNQLTGAKAGKVQVALTMAPENLSGATEFKHPYCNTATCLVVRIPLTTASGQTTITDWVLAKVDGAWNYIGTQLPYRVYAEPRLNRRLATNADGAAAGNTSDPYFFTSRYESVLRLVFDVNSPGAANVRAVRFSGPGLPAAGVVQVRSQRCGTDDRMGITLQNGSTKVNNSSALQFWTGGAAADFILDAARLDGSALAMPTPVISANGASFQDYSPVPVANQLTTMPAWSRYKVEIFHFDSASEAPDEVLYIRTGAPAENAAAGVNKPWPTLDSGFVSAYLRPDGASAGAVSSLATTLSWTAQAGTYVGSAYLFSQNFATATNAQNESASYGLRTRLDFEPAALGDSNGSGYQFASVVAGTSLSSYTATAGSNPNPRCNATGLVPLTSNTNDYRETGLSFRGTDRKLYNAIWFWDN